MTDHSASACSTSLPLSNPLTKARMRLTSLSVITVITLSLAGCASQPGTKPSGSSETTAATPAPRLAPAVAVPAASAKKVVLWMTGPKNVVEARDWAEFKREWRETFAEHAKEAGVAYTFVDAEPKPTGEDGLLLLVNVADYRIVGIGSRIFFGIMTGNAFIDAKVQFVGLRDGAAIGEQQYNTTSSAGAGIFAKVTPQQVNAIATNIFLDLKAAK